MCSFWSVGNVTFLDLGAWLHWYVQLVKIQAIDLRYVYFSI